MMSDMPGTSESDSEHLRTSEPHYYLPRASTQAEILDAFSKPSSRTNLERDNIYGKRKRALYPRKWPEYVVPWLDFEEKAEQAPDPFHKSATAYVRIFEREPGMVSNKQALVKEVTMILERAADIARCLGIAGRFEIYPRGTSVFGSPDCIWKPDGAESATICVTVMCPWDLSRWEIDALGNPEYDPAMDYTNLAETQEEGPVYFAIKDTFGYMLVNDHRYGILTTHSNIWILKRGHDIKYGPLLIAGPFPCNAEPPEFTLMKALLGTLALAQGEDWMCFSPIPSTYMRSLPPFPLADPYELHKIGMDMMEDMHSVTTRGSCALMKGTYRGQKCFLKLVDVHDKHVYNELQTEIEVYKHLQPLQGKSIPQFLGYGTLHVYPDVLILESCGEFDASATVDDFLGLLGKAHAAGVLHGDPAWRNLVRRASGEFVLIDFSLSMIGNFGDAEKKAEIPIARGKLSEW